MIILGTPAVCIVMHIQVFMSEKSSIQINIYMYFHNCLHVYILVKTSNRTLYIQEYNGV